MENNEDNRQMTVIAAALKDERENEREAGLEAQSAETEILRDTWNQQKLQHSYTISVLESLLPKEEESYITFGHDCCHQAYLTGSGTKRKVGEWFNETFKTHEYGK